MRTQVKNYTFTPGTRQITVTDDISFTKADIAVIVNRSQQKVLFTVPDYNLITDVTNKVITYDSSLPVLAENDVLWIEIDIEATATKIIREPAIVTVVGAEYHPNDWDLVAELAAHIPVGYPHCVIAKLSKTISTVLAGADAYYTSDGTFYENGVTHNWNMSQPKISNYVIFCFTNRDVNIALSALGITNIIELLLGDVNVLTLNLTASNIVRLWQSLETTYSNTAAITCQNSTSLCSVDLATCASMSESAFSGCVALSHADISGLINPLRSLFYQCAKLASIKLNGNISYGMLQNCAGLKVVIAPNCASVGDYSFYNSVGQLEYVKLGTFTYWPIHGRPLSASTKRFIIGLDTNINLDLRAGTALTIDYILIDIVPNLKDNTGLTAKTITFATAVYNNLVAAGYIALFTARNWNVAA